MTVQDILTRQLKYTNALDWRNNGITGKGIKIWNGEANGGHGSNTRAVLEQVAPEAIILSNSVGFRTRGDKLIDGAVFVNYPTLSDRIPMNEFLDIEQPCLLSQSEVGGNRAAEYVDYCKKIVKDYNLKIFNCEGNEGDDDDHETVSTSWPIEVCNVIGALDYMANGEVKRAGYSSVGADIDFCQFTSWFNGTSFATPFTTAMVALIYQRYGEMGIEETYQYLKMISDDLGAQNHDIYYGWGQPILPQWDKKYITMTTKTKTYYVNGKQYEMDTQPINKEGNVFVPIRVISEALGAVVNWKFNTDKTINITIDKGSTHIVLNTSDTLAFINGKKVFLNFAPFIDSNNRTLVPIRFIAEGLNCKVDWVQPLAKVMILEK